jgi:hypothetical protein
MYSAATSLRASLNYPLATPYKVEVFYYAKSLYECDVFVNTQMVDDNCMGGIIHVLLNLHWWDKKRRGIWTKAKG